MIRSEAKLSIFDVLKGQLGSNFNEKENASNKIAIKASNFVDLNPE
jgi:hypothetical protein